MKKILLIIALVLVMFQMVVLATAIDIGASAIDRSTYNTAKTSVNVVNPADYTGVITNIEIYANAAMSNVEVATFYVVSGNNLSTRDNETIGSVPAGYSAYAVSLNVTVGDYIGIYFSAGSIDRSTDNTMMLLAGDNIPCTNVTFGAPQAGTISLYGTGATLGWPHKWNTITIGKWDTVTFSKWNGLQ